MTAMQFRSGMTALLVAVALCSCSGGTEKTTVTSASTTATSGGILRSEGLSVAPLGTAFPAVRERLVALLGAPTSERPVGKDVCSSDGEYSAQLSWDAFSVTFYGTDPASLVFANWLLLGESVPTAESTALRTEKGLGLGATVEDFMRSYSVAAQISEPFEQRGDSELARVVTVRTGSGSEVLEATVVKGVTNFMEAGSQRCVE